MPYRFFALSNAGSMLGLLTYPVLIEPYLTSGQQAWMWSLSYVAFVLVCAVVAWRSRDSQAGQPSAAAVLTESTPPKLVRSPRVDGPARHARRLCCSP